MTDETESPEFTLTRTFEAPVTTVWQAWTDPRHLTHWFHPAGFSTPLDSIHVDLRVGGRYRYTMIEDETGAAHPTGGEFLEVAPPSRLVFTWASPEAAPGASPVATVTLDGDGERTRMVFTLRGTAGRPGDDGVHDGWQQAVEILAVHLGALEETSGPALHREGL